MAKFYSNRLIKLRHIALKNNSSSKT